MKRTLAKAAALVMAAMIAVPTAAAAYAPVPVYAVSNSSKNSDSGMKAALTIAKKRITVPEELSEFTYSTNESYGTKIYRFEWRTPDGAKEYKCIETVVMGNLVIYYYNYLKKNSGTPRLAKLSEEQLIEKAKGYAKQLDPDIYDKMKFEIGSLSLTSDTAKVNFTRYENGVSVPSNVGIIELDKNTGELNEFQCDWWENASFSDTKGAKTVEEIKAAYKKLCKLTPYYRISSEYDEKTKKYKKVVRLIYDPDMTAEIDAYTAERSTIRDDMYAADGDPYYGYFDVAATMMNGYGDEDSAAGEGYGGVEFTPEELEKIEKDKKLVKPAELTERFNKDPYIALNGNYKLDRYNIYPEKDENDKETVYMTLTYKFDKTKKADNYYETVFIRLNAETGEVKYFRKDNITSSDGLPKLDVKKANTIANNAAKAFSKDIFSQYRADKNNTKPAESWTSKENGKTVTLYEYGRYFNFNRYVNDIQVYNDSIGVEVDSLGTVVRYGVNHTENVKFPKADIITVDEAFDKLYKQKKFEYYYDGWIDKDGKVHTYLLYQMGEFYLNAKTGALCNWNGGKPYSYVDPRDISYTDIKGIPQEEAIRELQKYGVAVTTEKKFDPTALITEEEFAEFLSNALRSEVPAKDVSEETDAEKKDKAETTREEAAIIFTGSYYSDSVAQLKGIYKTPFTDVKPDDENIGYIAIAYGEGFIPLPENKKLDGSHKITRAEAAQMLYDYLKLISNKTL